MIPNHPYHPLAQLVELHSVLCKHTTLYIFVIQIKRLSFSQFNPSTRVPAALVWRALFVLMTSICPTFFCKPCLYSYCTVTVQSRLVQLMCYPMPSCQSLFATHNVQLALSDWDILKIENRDDSRDKRVAMARKAILHCEFGVAVSIAENDMGDGRITCAGAVRNRNFHLLIARLT
jgi:hypothetical protein